MKWCFGIEGEMISGAGARQRLLKLRMVLGSSEQYLAFLFSLVSERTDALDVLEQGTSVQSLPWLILLCL